MGEPPNALIPAPPPSPGGHNAGLAERRGGLLPPAIVLAPLWLLRAAMDLRTEDRIAQEGPGWSPPVPPTHPCSAGPGVGAPALEMVSPCSLAQRNPPPGDQGRVGCCPGKGNRGTELQTVPVAWPPGGTPGPVVTRRAGHSLPKRQESKILGSGFFQLFNSLAP